MNTVQWLRESGLAVQQLEPGLAGGARADAVLEVAAGGQHARFAVEVKQRAPYPNELERLGRLRETLSRLGQPLLVAPFVSETLGVALTGQGWSWADAQGDFDLRAPGLVLRQRRAVRLPRPVRPALPRGSGSFAVIRALIRSWTGSWLSTAGPGVRSSSSTLLTHRPTWQSARHEAGGLWWRYPPMSAPTSSCRGAAQAR